MLSALCSLLSSLDSLLPAPSSLLTAPCSLLFALCCLIFLSWCWSRSQAYTYLRQNGDVVENAWSMMGRPGLQQLVVVVGATQRRSSQNRVDGFDLQRQGYGGGTGR
jgi:hypothetical protein